MPALVEVAKRQFLGHALSARVLLAD